MMMTLASKEQNESNQNADTFQKTFMGLLTSVIIIDLFVKSKYLQLA